MSDILFSTQDCKHGSLGIITLNRPKALNALNYSMFSELTAQLKLWALDQKIKAVVIQSNSDRAFCAGGDIREVYQMRQQNSESIHEFFWQEYRLNHFIFHYPKPYIALCDGLTMGGGAGIAIHGSHAITTEKTQFAMPETTIGFYPDIGASYFLSRMPAHIGIYLGLTGNTIPASQALTLGVFQHAVNHDTIQDVVPGLAELDFENHPEECVRDYLNDLPSTELSPEPFPERATINECFSKPTVDEIINSLEKQDSEFAQTTLTTLQLKSPTSLKLTLEQLKRGKDLTFSECMHMEYRMTAHCLKQNDFFEGIRALLIDKDKQPKWQPDWLDSVSEEMLAQYFEKPETGDLEFIA